MSNHGFVERAHKRDLEVVFENRSSHRNRRHGSVASYPTHRRLQLLEPPSIDSRGLAALDTDELEILVKDFLVQQELREVSVEIDRGSEFGGAEVLVIKRIHIGRTQGRLSVDPLGAVLAAPGQRTGDYPEPARLEHANHIRKSFRPE